MSKEITLEMMVPENCLGRRLERVLDFEWLVGQIKPHIPDTKDRTSPAIRALLLIIIEHLEPHALPAGSKPFLAAIYDNWADNTSYMWLLRAVPWAMPVYQQISDFEDIPPFEDIFYPVADCLPPDVMGKLLAYILGRCVSSGIMKEYPEEPLYYMNGLEVARQETEIQRLAREYVARFYEEIAAYRDQKHTSI